MIQVLVTIDTTNFGSESELQKSLGYQPPPSTTVTTKVLRVTADTTDDERRMALAMQISHRNLVYADALDAAKVSCVKGQHVLEDGGDGGKGAS